MSSPTPTGTADPQDRVRSALTHLTVGVTSLLAGVVLGGWLAFETTHWTAFKSLVEGSDVVGPALAVGLCLLALATTLLASSRRVGR